MGMGPTAAASFLSCMWFPFPACGGNIPGSETPLASFLVEPSVCLKMAAGGFALPLQKYDLKGVQTWH